MDVEDAERRGLPELKPLLEGLARATAVLRTAHPKFQCLRGLLLLMSSLFAFLSLKYMPVAEFTAIGAIVHGLNLSDLNEASGAELREAQIVASKNELKAIDATTRVVMLTGYGSISTAIDAMRLGADNYVAKPADVDDILAAFERAEAPPLQPSADYKAPSLARAEWEHINRVLSDCGGNISEAARRLDVHRRSLQRKLQKYPPRE